MQKNFKTYLPLIIITLGILIRLWGYLVSPYHYYYRAGDENPSYIHAIRYLIAQEKIDNNIELNALEEKTLTFSAPGLGTGSLPGGFHSPLLAYTIKATDSVEGPLFMMLVLNCLTLLLVWWGTRALFNKRISLYALTMSALFFWPVQYTFGIWHPLFIPIFASVFYFLLAMYHRYQYGVLIGLFWFFYALSFQFHLIHGFLLFFLLFYFVFFVKAKKSFIAWGIVGGVLSLVLFFRDYLSYEFSNGFSNALGVHASGYYWEVFKLFSNALVVASAEISRIFYGGWNTYQDFYREYYFSFWIMVPLILISLAFPLLSFIILAKQTFIKLLKILLEKRSSWRDKKNTVSECMQKESSLWFVAGWFFIPWVVYFSQLKYHELRFMALDYPVMFVILAWFLVKLIDNYPRHQKLLKRVFVILVVFQASQSVFLNYYQQKEFERPPHLYYSVRHYNSVANAIVKDLQFNKANSYFITLTEHDDQRTTEWLQKLNNHIEITAEWKLGHKVKVDLESDLQYTFLPKTDSRIKNPDSEMNSTPINSIYLYRKKTY